MERARSGSGPALSVRRVERKTVGGLGGPRSRGAAAADPGHRQCRGLCHAGRVARRQFRLRQAAGRHQCVGRERTVAERTAAGLKLVPLDGAAIRHRDRPDQDANAACDDRPGLPDAVVLYGWRLRQPVQQVRPHLPGLRPGRVAFPPDDARYREPDGAKLERRHDSDRHGGEDYACGRPVPDQPVQSLSVRNRHWPAGHRLQLGPVDAADGADRREHAAARHRLRVDGDVVSGEGGRRSDLLRLRAGAAAGLSRARRPV
ncbi:hypothetical protein ES703_66365 [subsurface metagenome]